MLINIKLLYFSFQMKRKIISKMIFQQLSSEIEKTSFPPE